MQRDKNVQVHNTTAATAASTMGNNSAVKSNNLLRREGNAGFKI